MSDQQRAGPSSSTTPDAVQQLVLRAELHAATVTEALGHYEAALEQLNAHFRWALKTVPRHQVSRSGQPAGPPVAL